MSNPWLKKNPFMSVWLSTAHRVLGSLRGTATAQAKRQVTAALNGTGLASPSPAVPKPKPVAKTQAKPDAKPKVKLATQSVAKTAAKPPAKPKAKPKPALRRKR